MTRYAVAAAAALVAAGSANFATAQTKAPPQAESVPCLERSAAIEHLGRNYQETPVALGLTNTGAVLEVLSSKSGENWTIIVTLPNGKACMIAAGKNWELMPYVATFGPKA